MTCLFCYSSNIKPANFPRSTIFNNKRFDYKKCIDCGLIFIDPLPTEEDYNKMYGNNYHDAYYFKDAIPDYSNWLQLFKKFSKGNSVLDYGCGDGSFLRFFENHGYECIGVEYDPELVARLKKENPAVTFYTIEEFWSLSLEKKFDVIFMGDVLEHIATPAKFLKQLIEKIKTSGLIAAQGPLEENKNLALSFRKLMSKTKSRISKSSLAVHIPYHIFFSNASNQKKLFESSGFESLYYEVFETAWPFPDKFSLKPSGMKNVVARTSIFLSQKLPGKRGNRFMYIGEKK